MTLIEEPEPKTIKSIPTPEKRALQTPPADVLEYQCFDSLTNLLKASEATTFPTCG